MKMLVLLSLFLLVSLCTIAQDSLLGKVSPIYIQQVSIKSQKYERLMQRHADKILSRTLRIEHRISRFAKKHHLPLREVLTPDSIQHLFDASMNNYTAEENIVGTYAGLYIDSLENALKFLEQRRNTLTLPSAEITKSLEKVKQLKQQFTRAEKLKQQLHQRQKDLQTQLQGFAQLNKLLIQYNKRVYYYSARMREYQTLFSDRKKAEAKAMTLLSKSQMYQEFLRKNSQLASLFNLSDDFNTSRSLEGLQTRNVINRLVTQRVGSDAATQQAVSQQMEVARQQFSELKKKFPELDNAGEIPNFKPSPLKSKPLLQRLEWGSNIQFQKSSSYFPTTSDLAVQVGYKFNMKGTAGIGMAYKLGIGKDWSHIAFSHQGLGFRSFVDWKLKGNFYVHCGYELDKHSISTASINLPQLNGYQESALLGISKKYKVNTRIKGNLMVLYDFFAPRQLPKTDNIKVRIGYSL